MREEESPRVREPSRRSTDRRSQGCLTDVPAGRGGPGLELTARLSNADDAGNRGNCCSSGGHGQKADVSRSALVLSRFAVAHRKR